MFTVHLEWLWKLPVIIMEIDESSRILFMKYALPCAGTLVKRGSVNQKYVDQLVGIASKGGKIPKDAEKIFKVAFAACALIAIDAGKKIIDDNIVRKYFLSKHDKIIGKRYAEMGDFDPDMCRVRKGTVECLENEFAFVNGKKFRTDFVPEVKNGDEVVTHWDFIVEASK